MSLDCVYNEIEIAKELIKTETNAELKFELQHYLDGLYDFLDINGVEIKDDLLRDFDGFDNYSEFEDKLNEYTLGFLRRFSFIKESLSKYIKSYIDCISSIPDCDLPDTSIEPTDEDIFSKEEFFKIVNRFCISIGKEKELNELLLNNRIILDREHSQNIGGLTVNNPITFNNIIYIDNFKYNIESMIVLIHELGHVFDYQDFKERFGSSRVHDYHHNNIGLENYSVMLEAELLDYLLINNIETDEVKKSYASLIELRFFDIMYFYIITCLNNEHFIDGSIMEISNKKMYKECLKKFKDKKALKEYISCMDESFSYIIQYGYACLLSLVFKNNKELFSEFLNRRLEFFDYDFFEEFNITDELISKLYSDEIKKIKRL